MNASLSQLPPEIIHRIFDHCDTQTLLRSIRPASKYLSDLVTSYDRFELDLRLTTKAKLKVIHRFVQPERVSLMTNITEHTLKRFMLFFDIRQFSRLRSLAFTDITHKQLQHFFEQLTTDSVTSVSLDLQPDESSIASTLISLLVDTHCPRPPSASDETYIPKRIKYSHSFRLQFLKIRKCSMDDYISILVNFPQLRTIHMMDCIVQDASGMTDSTFSTFTHTCLKSLTITKCTFSLQQMETILSLTPSLLHLTLSNSKECDFAYSFNAGDLEQLIHARLPRLARFDFFLSASDATHDIQSLQSVIESFETPFWRQITNCSVRAAYFLVQQFLAIYTAYIPMVESNQQTRVEYSCMDTSPHLTARSIQMLFDPKEQVVRAFSSTLHFN
ncbi:unnamed protein product [Rotaria socialis]|uniref:F-box domain-containing protein n=1 Tax=Rotaria socialis TaxID=392032 RepID=A0A818BUZ2_9BILA|nr:unnamed protein product [Rotaria socialis]